MITKVFKDKLLRYLLLFCISSFIGGSGYAQTVNILPLGNSITQSDAANYSYRYELWKKLIDDGVDFDFIGSQTSHDGGLPSFPPYLGHVFDKEHEGHSGKRADEILAEFPSWINYTPHIVLLHAGTNDMLQLDGLPETKQDLKDIITMLRGYNPDVIILLAQIIPYSTGPGKLNVPAFNDLVAQIPGEMVDEDSPIYIVDQYTGFDATVGVDTYDGIHPNSSGEVKMAEKWRVAINQALADLPELNMDKYGLDFSLSDYSTSDRVTIPGMPATAFSSVTYEAWVKLDSYYAGAGSENSGSFVFCRQYVDGSSGDFGPCLAILSEDNNGGAFRKIKFGMSFEADGDDQYETYSNTEFPLNEWHHIACTWDGSTMDIYVDGTLNGSSNVSTLGQYWDPATIFYLGFRHYSSRSNFDGMIDEVRIWNYAKTQQEIRDAMYHQLTGSETNLFAYWNLNEIGGQVVQDSGPGGYDGKIGASYATEDYDPQWTFSTAPIPYFSENDGNWTNNATWAQWQNAPVNSWADVELNNIVTVDANKTVEDISIKSAGALTVNSSNSLTINGDFLIQSTESGTGSVINNGTLTYASADVQQYLSEDQWHYVSSSVDNQESGVFSGLYLKEWDEPTEEWTYITSLTEPINDMMGYASWSASSSTGDATIAFSGTLNDGNYSRSLTNTAGTTAPPGEDPTGYNFVGNPYPSGIDWDGSGWTKTNVDDAIYVITYQNGVRQYGSYIGTTSTHGVTNEIAPHQGFYVKCSSIAGGSIGISNDARIHTSQEFFKNTEDLDQLIRMKVVGNGLWDETVVRVKSSASSGFDGQYDAYKMKGAVIAPQLYTISTDNKLLSINSIQEIKKNTIIPIGFECGEEGLFEFYLTEYEELEDMSVYLEDKKTNKMVNIKESPGYKFIGSVEDESHRFNLRFTAQDIPVAGNNNGDFIVYPKNSEIAILMNSNNTDATVMIYDLSGKQVYNGTITQGENLVKPQYSSGYLLVKIITQNNIITEKVFLK